MKTETAVGGAAEAASGGQPQPAAPASDGSASNDAAMPRPSNHYPPIDPPIDYIVARSTAAQKPVVPRRQVARPVPSRTLVPLDSHPLGPGRAAQLGEIEAEDTLYVGQVLAGQPHGQGKEYLKGVPALNAAGCFLAYQGHWDKGRKTGQGTVFSLNGETYTGQLVDGVREGTGRMTYLSGDVYEGGWERGARSGLGQLRSATSGDVFVGRFRSNQREGPGALYMVSKGKKYLAEYVAGEPKCGVWDDITAEELAALTGHDAQGMLSSLAASKRSLPVLGLDTPYDVLAARLQQLRRPHRGSGGGAGGWDSKAEKQVPPGGAAGTSDPGTGSCGGHNTLSAVELEAVRLAAAYEAAGGGGSRGGAPLCTEQLRRLCDRVKELLGEASAGQVGVVVETLAAAGQPAAPAEGGPGGGGSITYDRLMAALCGAGNAAW